jgi:hypothetical protein
MHPFSGAAAKIPSPNYNGSIESLFFEQQHTLNVRILVYLIIVRAGSHQLRRSYILSLSLAPDKFCMVMIDA